MEHVEHPRARRSGASTVGAAAISGLILAFLVWPTMAADRPADIRAKERSDPAAGEIIIINRKKSAGETPSSTASAKPAPPAPDPYAPRATREAERDVQASAPPATEPRRRSAGRPEDGSSPSRVTTSPPETATEARRSEPAPPLPDLNREPRPRHLARRTEDEWRSALPPPRRNAWDEREARTRDWRDDDWREEPRAWDRPRYRRDWRYETEPPRRSFAYRRPWRACRRLARLCEDGFERACWRWQQRCND